MPDITTIKNEIRDFIASLSYIDPTMIHDDTLIIRDSVIESIGIIQMVVFVEENYGVQMTDKDLIEENFESVNAITKLIQQKLANI